MRNDDIASRLRSAQSERNPCIAPTTDYPDIGIEDAYAIQKMNILLRVGERGMHGRLPRQVGWKVGITSRAVQEWLGVGEPDFGALLDDMEVPNGGVADTSALLQPRVEGEIAFVLKKCLTGPGVSLASALAAIDFILPAIEIIDSRVVDWKFKIQDTIADNASSAMFVLGSTPVLPQGLDLRMMGATLRLNGAVASTGAGAACLGNPVNALVWLANRLGELGEGLATGQVILSGALGPVSPVVSGDYVEVAIGRMPPVSVAFA